MRVHARHIGRPMSLAYGLVGIAGAAFASQFLEWNLATWDAASVLVAGVAALQGGRVVIGVTMPDRTQGQERSSEET
jgi:hypothetical protein